MCCCVNYAIVSRMNPSDAKNITQRINLSLSKEQFYNKKLQHLYLKSRHRYIEQQKT